MLDLAAVLALAQACAPSVAPQTLAAIAHVESRFDALAIGVNGGGPRPRRAVNAAEAARAATRLIARGENLDLGLAQINSDNLVWLGLSVEGAFDPCRNLAAAATVLVSGFRPTGTTVADRQAALRTALSRYNTGDPRRGVRNGYVARVEAAAVTLGLTEPGQSPRSPDAPLAVPPPARREGSIEAPVLPAPWDVFGRGPRNTILFSTSTPR